MLKQLRTVLGDELRRRHGYGCMTGKVRPVHVANALMREEHHAVGRMGDLNHLLLATAPRESHETRVQAIKTMLERNRDRWGRLGEEENLRQSLLMKRVLPLLRTIIATDGATFGKSRDFSSFSSPTAATVTRDISDERAGAFLHRLWGGHESADRLRILDLLHKLTDPSKPLEEIDDLTAILLPLVDETVDYRSSEKAGMDLVERPFSPVETALRSAAEDLWRYEAALRPNPIASLQRIVLLGSLSLFFHGATRSVDWGGMPRRLLLLDASNTKNSPVAEASEGLVVSLLDDARAYQAQVLSQLLTEQNPGWVQDPEVALDALFSARLRDKGTPAYQELHDLLESLEDAEVDRASGLPASLVDLLGNGSGQSLDGYLRLLGLRCGLLYPQQKNPNKRLVPTPRTLEVLVASTFDLTGRPMEFKEFLDVFFERWGIVTGGRLEDAALLAASGNPVPSADLKENAERVLSRLEALGLARRLADSVAVVGLMESDDVE